MTDVNCQFDVTWNQIPVKNPNMEDERRVQLSKTILEMKFMKRTKERVQKEKEDAEGKAMYSSEITEEMKKSGNIIFTETSIFNCRNLIEGRLSFGGMNPEIEKLMDKRKQEVDRRKETDISDAQMAQEYSSLVDTMASKFSGKKSRNKRKFVKPSEDIKLI